MEKRRKGKVGGFQSKSGEKSGQVQRRKHLRQ